MNAVDLEGMEPIYNSHGIYLGCTKEGFTGQIYIYSGSRELDFSQYSIDYLLHSDESFYLFTYEYVATHYEGKAMENFVSNVMTDIVTHFNGIDVYGTRFDINTLYNKKIEYEEMDGTNFHETLKDGKISIKASKPISRFYEATVENLASSLIVHEWYGHGVRRYGKRHKTLLIPTPNHHKVYELVKGYDKFFKKTTPKYKSFVNKNWLKYYNEEQL